MLKEFHKWHVVITDASCFILLDKIDALHILPALFPHIITTPEIALEFGKPLPEWVDIVPVNNKRLQQTFEEEVDLGEASAIALANEITSALLIIDDLKGRKLAQRLQLMHTGTLGVLVLAKQKGVITSLKPHFDQIQKTNFRVSTVLLQSLLKTAGE